MVTVAEAIREGMRGIRAEEPIITRQLLESYERAWWNAERIIRRYEAYIRIAQESGDIARSSWLRRQVWYRQLQASIDAEFVRFQGEALTAIIRGQRDAVAISAESAALLEAAIGVSSTFRGGVNPSTVERWVSGIRPNSPIRRVIAKYGTRAESAIVQSITDGITGGEGINQIVRNIERVTGPDVERWRLNTLARTEVHRASRGASRTLLTDIGRQVPGTHEWEWLASKSARTCLACISMDGRRFPFNQYPDRFHVACRCSVVLRVSESVVPGQYRRETGDHWLARQDEAVQRRIIGTQGRWELYQQGVGIDRMVGITRSRTWGDSLRVKSAKEIAT